MRKIALVFLSGFFILNFSVQAATISPDKCVPILVWMEQGAAHLNEVQAQKLCRDGTGNYCQTVKNEAQAICQIFGGNQCGRAKNISQALCWTFLGSMCDAKKSDEDATTKAQLKTMCMKSTLGTP